MIVIGEETHLKGAVTTSFHFSKENKKYCCYKIVECRAIKLSFTPLRHEIYDLKIENGIIYGKYRGRLFNRKDKIKYLLEAIFYAFLGRYFLGTPGYVMAGLAEIEPEGKYEEDASKDFSFKLDEIKIKVKKNILKIKAKGKKMKFLIDKYFAEELNLYITA